MKAQTEIFGLVFIVILLIIGGIILFSIGKNSRTLNTQEFTDPEMAQSLLNALMTTKTDKNILVQDIIRDCYNARNDLCKGDGIETCCEYAQKTIENALSATLGDWKRIYKLSVDRSGSSKINDIGNPKCTDKKEQYAPGYYYIPPPPTIIVTLRICK